jgi:hypothetical protein
MNEMKKILEQTGWIHYASGCPCTGLPRFYKHNAFPDYKIILKAGYATIRKHGTDKFKTNNIDQLKQKLKEYELIKTDN